MLERTLIKDLQTKTDGPTKVSGWVETIRDQKRVQFIILRDETSSLQLVRGKNDPADELSETISSLTHGSFITVTGQLKHDERVKLGGLEIEIEGLDVASIAFPEPPVTDDSSVDKRMDWRFLDLRRPEAQLIFRVQTTLTRAWRDWWVDNDYIEIFTPKLMSSPSESRAELFEVGYFDRTAYLAQSPQFFKQMAQAAGFGKMFEIGPAFRADPSFTSRHATEFTSVDSEISWIDSHEDVMKMHEELMAVGLAAVADKHGAEIEKMLGVTVQVPTTPFPRIPLAEAHQMLTDSGYTVPREDGDLDPEGERRLSALVKEKFGSEFVFVTDYHHQIRPFYHMRSETDSNLTNSYDLLYNGAEISTGAQREHRIDVLEVQANEKKMDTKELGFYLDFFRHGVPPHGGFGMGLGRVIMLMLNQSSIREVTYLFRGPNHLQP